MAENQRQRKLSTILAMDVVDYTAKMGSDEDGTLEQLAECKTILDQIVLQQDGRIFNTAGDAFMIEFSSISGAVTAGIQFQKKMADRNEGLSMEKSLEFRMGINMGDVVIDGENLFGDGVNVAARLEGICPRGGICISGKIFSEIEGRVDVGFIDQGMQTLKNVEKPVRAYFLDLTPGAAGSKRSQKSLMNRVNLKWIGAAIVVVIALSVAFVGEKSIDRGGSGGPSLNTIAVLPLESIGEGKEDNFATGLSQDMVNGLSRAAPSLNIIGLGERPEDLRKLGESTGAQYLINGSLRRSGDEIRVAVSLVDTSNMATIWTENFDRTMTAENVFALQDAIVEGIVNELVGGGAVLTRDIVKRIETKGTDNLTAYECVNYARGVAQRTLSPETHQKAMKCLREAVEQDPAYGKAWERLAYEIGWGYALFGTATIEDLSPALEMLGKALKLDPQSVEAYLSKAQLLFYQKDFPGMFKADDKALSLAPNSAAVLGRLAQDFLWGGDCTREQILDVDAKQGTYTDGNCRWQSGVIHGEKAHLLDSANLNPYENYSLAIHYIMKKDFQRTLNMMELVPSPGFLWWDIYVGTAYDALENEEKAKERFESIKTGLGGNKLEVIKTHFDFWNIVKTYYPTFEPVLIKYGFE